MFVLRQENQEALCAFAVCHRNGNIGKILSILIVKVIIIFTMIAYLIGDNRCNRCTRYAM